MSTPPLKKYFQALLCSRTWPMSQEDKKKTGRSLTSLVQSEFYYLLVVCLLAIPSFWGDGGVGRGIPICEVATWTRVAEIPG